MNLDKFVKDNFNKASFVGVSFSEFKKTYAVSMRGHDITEVAKKLGINTTGKKPKKKVEKDK